MSDEPSGENDLRVWSARPGSNGASSDPDQIVLVPPQGDLAVGFDLARKLIAEGHEVRLVGHGASLQHEWPSWVRSTEGLVLTEIGAYVRGSPVDATRPFRLALAAWLNRIFESPVAQSPPSDVFYGSACVRLFQPALDAAPYVQGLVDAHPRATVHCVAPSWPGLPLLVQALAAHEGKVAGWSWRSRGRLPWGMKLCAATVAGMGSTLALQVREWIEARPGYAALRAHSVGRSERPRPKAWVALVADWPRMNRHLVDAFVLPELALGTGLGILLLGRLAPGGRLDANLARVGTDLWPGLGEVRSHLDRCTIDQMVAPGSTLRFASAVMRAFAVTSKATARLALAGPLLEEGPLRFDLQAQAWPMAKLLTMDVVRGFLADAATRDVVARHEMAGACVVLAGSSLTDTSAADLVLQSAGANTLEYYHGAGMEGWIGAQETRARYRCRYTRADAETAKKMGFDALVAGMPIRVRGSQRPIHKPPRVLLLTNYVHRDYTIDGRFPFEPYQGEVLAVAAGLRFARPDLTIRWRPHPADNPQAIARGHARTEGVERSPSATLEEDLEWSDVVVSTMSTTVLEGMLAGLPVFVHVPPEVRDGPNARFVDERRVFFRAESVISRILEVLSRLERADPAALEPERLTCAAFFGPDGSPRSLGDVLREVRLIADEASLARGGVAGATAMRAVPPDSVDTASR